MLYDASCNAVTFRTNWKRATDAELSEAMDMLDATIRQPEGGLRLRYSGAFANKDMPHYEYWRRSVMNATFGEAI